MTEYIVPGSRETCFPRFNLSQLSDSLKKIGENLQQEIDSAGLLKYYKCQEERNFKQYFLKINRIFVFDRINKISSLGENWNNYGAARMEEVVIDNTKNMLKCFPDSFFKYLHFEDVYPSTYSTVILEWRKNNNIVSVEVGTGSASFFSEINGEDKSIDKFNIDSIEVGFRDFCSLVSEQLSNLYLS